MSVTQVSTSRKPDKWVPTPSVYSLMIHILPCLFLSTNYPNSLLPFALKLLELPTSTDFFSANSALDPPPIWLLPTVLQKGKPLSQISDGLFTLLPKFRLSCFWNIVREESNNVATLFCPLGKNYTSVNFHIDYSLLVFHWLIFLFLHFNPTLGCLDHLLDDYSVCTISLLKFSHQLLVHSQIQL